MARQLIASLSDDFDADRFEDTYRNQVLDLIERKAAGDTEIVAPPEVMSEDKVVDLMAALEASVKEAKAARTRHPAGAPDAEDEAAAGQEAHPQVGVARGARPGRRDRRAAAQGHEPRQGAVPGRRVHQGRGDRLLRARRAGDAAAHRRPRGHAAPLPERRRRARRSSRSAARRTGPSGSARSQGPGDRNGTIGYCALDSVAALAWSANMAALEIHAPMARGDDIESPTMCVFDLDPGPAAPASPSARRWRSTSARCSTTSPGSTCLRQDVGLEGPAGVRAAQHAAHPRALLRVRPGGGPGAGEAPPEARSRRSMAKAARPGKVFIDWSQNSRHKTTVAVVLAAGPTASDRVHAGDVGRGGGGGRRGRPQLRGRRRARPRRGARRPLRRRP